MSKKETLPDGAAKDTATPAFDQEQPTHDMIHIDIHIYVSTTVHNTRDSVMQVGTTRLKRNATYVDSSDRSSAYRTQLRKRLCNKSPCSYALLILF